MTYVGGDRLKKTYQALHRMGCCLVGVCLWGVVTPLQAAYRVEMSADKALKDLLTENLDVVRYQTRDDLNEDQFNYLLMAVSDQVQQLMATEGYFLPTTHARVESREGERVVHLQVDAHERTFISQVDLELTGDAAKEVPPRIDRIRKNWRLPVGQPFRQADWDNAKDRALQNLQRRRYAAAKIDASEARVDPQRHTAELEVDIDSGPVFTLGALQVSGLKRYPESIVHNMNPLVLGEEYDSERLLELQRQVQSTPYFSNVQVSIDNNPEHAKLTPVKVQISEFPTQQVRLGGGYASDTGAHVEGKYAHYNVFNRAWVFNSQIKLEQRHQLESLELAMPPGDKGFVNSGHASVDRTTLQGVDLRSLRTGIQRARTQEKYTSAFALDYYRDDLEMLDGAILPSQTVASPGKHQALVPSFTWSRRDVDNLIFPRKGNMVFVQAGLGLKGLVTDESFTRVYGRVRQYIAITNRDRMIFRGEGGAVFSRGGSSEVPASLLFRAGGTESIRGYAYQSIGNLQNGTVFPTKYLATGGAEYQHWISAQWGGAVFYDLGTATNTWSDKVIYQGLGVGVRWRSPVGPVNVDLAYGVRDAKFRPHISLGVAF